MLMIDLMITLFYLKINFIALGLWISWKWFVMIYLFVHIKVSYYCFNRQELLQKAKDKYHGGKEEAAEYYLKNRGRGLQKTKE